MKCMNVFLSSPNLTRFNYSPIYLLQVCLSIRVSSLLNSFVDVRFYNPFEFSLLTFFIVGYKADSKGVTFCCSLKMKRRGRCTCVWHFTFVSTNVPGAFIATKHRSGQTCDLCSGDAKNTAHHLAHISPPRCAGGVNGVELKCKCLIFMFYSS